MMSSFTLKTYAMECLVKLFLKFCSPVFKEGHVGYFCDMLPNLYYCCKKWKFNF